MTELEKMKHAQSYILDLANGVDPISKETMSEDTCLNNVRLSRCFFYVAEVLGQVINNGGHVGKGYEAVEFVLTEEFKARIPISDRPMGITDFVKSINDVAMEFGMKRVPITAFTNWLMENEYLKENSFGTSKKKIPADKGTGIGIYTREYTTDHGTFTQVMYNVEAQRFLIESLDVIVERWKKGKGN